MKTKTLLCLFFTGITAVFAQPIGVGIKAGVPLTSQFRDIGNFQSDTKRYIVGPMVELRLPAGFAIEGDALYTKVSLSGPLSAAGSIFGSVVDTNSWEFPVLLKKKFGGSGVGVSIRPYVEAGASFRHLTGLGDLPSFITGGRGVDTDNTGFVAGGGVEFKLLILRVSPEFRYTRWGTQSFLNGVSNVWQFQQNQGQFLVGISF